MRGILKSAAALLGLMAAPLAATAPDARPSREQAEVMLAADAFFAALRSEDRTALATVMLPEGVIFIHNRMEDPEGELRIVPVASFLEGHEARAVKVDEVMSYDVVLVDGDMAQLWGPYSFWVEYELVHCGINSLSLVRTEAGWKVANTSFTMEQPSACERLGVPGFPAEAIGDEAP